MDPGIFLLPEPNRKRRPMARSDETLDPASALDLVIERRVEIGRDVARPGFGATFSA
jgi:hypothetical protein